MPKHFLTWTIPSFSRHLLDNEAKENERVSEIESPNTATTKPEFPGIDGNWQTKQFKLRIDCVVDNDKRLNVTISGEIVLDGPQKPTFGQVRFWLGRIRSCKTAVEVKMDEETKQLKNFFNFRSFSLNINRPVPEWIEGFLEVQVMFPETTNGNKTSESENSSRGQVKSKNRQRRSGGSVTKLRANHNVLPKFRQFFEEGKFTDLILTAEGQKVKVHQAILAASSEVLEKMLLEGATDKNGMMDLGNNIDLETLKVVVDFCYGFPVKERLQFKEIAEKAQRAAKIFQLSALEEACVPGLDGKLTLSNVAATFMYAKNNGLEDLAQNVVDFVRKDLVAFAKTGGFEEMVKNGKGVAAEFFVRVAQKSAAA